jgi:DNA-binding HxlR family transcriptional regulator
MDAADHLGADNDGPTRFGVLRRKVDGIAARMLTVRLRALETEGIIWREFTPGAPSEATYGLTTMAQELAIVLKQMREIADRWTPGSIHRVSPARADATHRD